MRRTLSLLALAAIIAAAPAALPGSANAQVRDVSALVGKLQPHRAIYSLKVKTLSDTGGVSDAGGAIAYELSEECGRWVTKHTFLLRIVRADTKERLVRTDYTSWESKDGLTFGFETRTTTDGQESEFRKGTARLDRIGGPGTAVIEGKGPRKDLKLPAGTVFPTWQIVDLMAAGRAGEKLLWQHVFDGSSEGKVSGVYALIADAVPAATIEPVALFNHPGWRFRLTFFDPPAADKERPNYRVEMTANEGGITTDMVLDYGDFAVRAGIEKIESLRRAQCR